MSSRAEIFQSRNRSFSQRKSSQRKHVPIFNSGSKSSSFDPFFNSYMGLEMLNQTKELNVINYDFCGCESILTCCDVLASSVMRNVHVGDMKNSYYDEFSAIERSSIYIDFGYKKQLLDSLPKKYPEIYVPHLNNLIKVIGTESLTLGEFECLISIQYHTKIEYITYYLYKDIKKCFNDKNRFVSQLENELILKSISIRSVRINFNDKGLGTEFDKFVSTYFESVGANLIPMTYYAKFLTLLYNKGTKMLVKMLSNFLAVRTKELEEGLRRLRFGDLETYRSYMRSLNFEDFILRIE